MSVTDTPPHQPQEATVKQLVTTPLVTALEDIAAGIKLWRIGAWLGWRDAILPLRRTLIGPFWITIQSTIWALIIITLFGPSLGAGYPIYPLYVASGVVFFQYQNGLIVDGAGTYLKDAGLVQNIPNPLSVYLLRVVFKSLILLLVNFPIVVVAYFFVPASITWTALMVIPMMIVVTITLTGFALFLASLTPLYRDIPYALQAIMRVMFFATPVFWRVESRGGIRAAIAEWNPLGHMLALMREPFLGNMPPLDSLFIVIACGVVAWIIGIIAFSQTRSLIATNL